MEQIETIKNQNPQQKEIVIDKISYIYIKYMKITQRRKIKSRRKKNGKKKSKKSKRQVGGLGKVYTESGDILTFDNEYYKSKDFFKKMSPDRNEKKISEIIFLQQQNNNSNENIVDIYQVGNDSIIIELLDTNWDELIPFSKAREMMINAKNYLQSLGIIYLDWKRDNMGVSRYDKKTLKLFDFDCSGLVKREENGQWSWVILPDCYFYMEAVKNGITDPFEIDDYIFDTYFQ